jgi:uncharacterized protein YggE
MEKTKLKSIMLTCIVLASTFICMSVFVRPGIANITEQPSEKPELGNLTSGPHGTITVTGTAQRECEPELLCIYIKIITLDPTSAVSARDEAARIIDRVLKSLENLGISKDDIETASYDIQPKYQWENYMNVFKGYEVIVIMKVTLKNFDKAGQVIDASVNAGALIDRISFELSKDKQNEIKIQVMADAARDAKAKAEAVTDALDEELGNVKSVNIDNYAYNPYVYYKYDAVNFAGGESAPPTSILPSDLTISASVSVVFDIL